MPTDACCVINCNEVRGRKNSGSNNEKISFHSLPISDKKMLKKWILTLRGECSNWKPTKNTRICSKHFTPDCFQQSGWSSRKSLKKDAVPSVCIFPDVFVTTENKREQSSKSKKQVKTLSSQKNQVVQIDSSIDEMDFSHASFPHKLSEYEDIDVEDDDEMRILIVEPSSVETETMDEQSESELQVWATEETNLCRFCTKPVDEDGIDMFSEDERSIKIRQMINVVLPGQIHEQDGLPHHICIVCIGKWKDCYETVLAFFASEAYFRSEGTDDRLKEQLVVSDGVVEHDIISEPDEPSEAEASNSSNQNSSQENWEKMKSKTNCFEELEAKGDTEYEKDDTEYMEGDIEYPRDGTEYAKDDTEYAKGNTKYATDDTEYAKGDSEYATDDNEYANDNMECATDDTEYAKDDTEYVKYDTECATDDTEYAKDDIECATDDTEYAKYDTEYVKYDTECATDDVEYAKDDIECATDDTECVTDDTACAKDDIEYAKDDTECATDDTEFATDVREIFCCTKCSVVFKQRKSLLFHIQSNHSEGTVRFFCEHCPEVFNFKHLLVEHKKLKHKKQICKFCGEAFYFIKSLDRHLSVHDNNTTCSTCNKEFKSSYWRRIHEKLHTIDNNHLCWICGKIFQIKASLHSHLQLHEELRVCPYKCEICEKEYLSLSGINKHKQTHKEREKIFKCVKCNKDFFTNELLKQHFACHSKMKPFICHCGEAFKRYSTLYNHKKRHLLEQNLVKPKRSVKRILNKDTEVFNCSICEKEIVSQLAFKYHMAKHTGDKKPFDCEVCGALFGNLTNYRNHLKIHSTDLPFVCETCGLGFRTGRMLKQHKLMHAEIRPYKCPLCPVSFKRLYSLKEHKIVHSGLRPFNCTVCNRAFARRSDCRKHVKQTHKIPLEQVEFYFCNTINNGRNDKSNKCSTSDTIEEQIICEVESEDKVLFNEIRNMN